MYWSAVVLLKTATHEGQPIPTPLLVQLPAMLIVVPMVKEPEANVRLPLILSVVTVLTLSVLLVLSVVMLLNV